MFAYSPLPERAPLRWPCGARVALYLSLNVEHYRIDKPSTSIFAGTSLFDIDAKYADVVELAEALAWLARLAPVR